MYKYMTSSWGAIQPFLPSPFSGQYMVVSILIPNPKYKETLLPQEVP